MKTNQAPVSGETKSAGVKVKITAENGHTHARLKYPKDEVITVSEGDAALIVDTFKVGERVKGE
ncbi:hypothetical protein [Pseudomonas citronellolis]|uniref:hypothetical protein n=1 Tax=Pseudomonas citronellolis TaxID=53408 RepID=UPI000778EF38|nr:hypothetical protein [Pseudomonas citronellolis]AMO73847.1 hypothetical protein PcP3B5_03350 [Pseudomonas citronellolis]